MPQNNVPFISQPCGDPVGGIIPGGEYGTFRLISLDASGNVNVNIVSGGGGGSVVSVSNFPAVQPVSGTFWQATQPVSGNISVTGAVSVSNFPASQVVTLASTTITGSVAVTGTFFQATQPISGTVTVNQGTSPWVVSLTSTTITGTVSVTQGTSPWVVSLASTTITGSVAVTGTFFQATQPISGAISFTAPQHVIIDSATLGTVAVSGSVSVSNFPATQAVTGTFFQATQPISGTVSISGTVPVSGTIAVTQSGTWTVGISASQTIAVTNTGTFAAQVTGTVAVSNFPASQVVTLASTTITGTVSVTQGTSPWVVSLASTTITGTPSFNLAQLNAVALGSPSNYGTSPGAVSVQGVNAFITNTPAVTLASTTITGTVSVTQGTSPWVVSLASTTITGTVSVTQGTSPWVISGAVTIPTPTNWGTAPATSVAVPAVNAYCFQGTSPWVVSLASTTITGTVSVTQGTSPWVVSLTSTTITGTVAENLTQVAGVTLGATAVTAYGTAPAAANVPGVNAFITNTPAVTLASTTITGTSAFNLTQWASTALGVPTAFGTTPGNVGIVGSVNASLFIGTVAAVASSAGVQKVGISGAAGATLDAVITAATAPTDGLATLVEYVSTPPALTTGQSVMAQANSAGDTFVKPYRRSETSSQATTIAASVVATNILPVGGTGVFVDLSTLILSVVPVATGTANVTFTASLKDGTKTYIYDMNTGDASSATLAGTESHVWNLQFNPPLPASTSATQWTITLSVSTNVTVHITAVGVLQTAS